MRTSGFVSSSMAPILAGCVDDDDGVFYVACVRFGRRVCLGWWHVVQCYEVGSRKMYSMCERLSTCIADLRYCACRNCVKMFVDAADAITITSPFLVKMKAGQDLQSPNGSSVPRKRHRSNITTQSPHDSFPSHLTYCNQYAK